jgi:putative ABC transport system ATP-binding protein
VPSAEAILRAEDVHKSFGDTKALDGISLEVAAGELVAIMGPSGSGKSTLVHSLAGIIPVDGGSITYRSTELSRLSDNERTILRRTDFGFVFQFGQLLNELSCLDNVALPLLLNRTSHDEAYRTAAERLTELGLTDQSDKLVGELSGGQAQRVAVARALVHRPAVVFADEPTGSLDSLNGERVMEMLTESTKQLGTTLLLITHDPKVAAYCERLVIVRDGRIAVTEKASAP